VYHVIKFCSVPHSLAAIKLADVTISGTKISAGPISIMIFAHQQFTTAATAVEPKCCEAEYNLI
jgi:hypothetical protein